MKRDTIPTFRHNTKSTRVCSTTLQIPHLRELNTVDSCDRVFALSSTISGNLRPACANPKLNYDIPLYSSEAKRQKYEGLYNSSCKISNNSKLLFLLCWKFFNFGISPVQFWHFFTVANCALFRHMCMCVCRATNLN